MDAQLPQSSNEKVELAILWFLDQFRKTYVGDQLQHTSKVNIYCKPCKLKQKSLCSNGPANISCIYKLWSLAGGWLDRWIGR